ncbi:MAG: D-alanyl-D-alanine carboxypeptidase, partial [Proteobacteria bacterium]|nr:D-alanyl-D-alanine carboxypeptidase [Pseudomonadota bacterium]
MKRLNMKSFWLGLALFFTVTTWAAPPNVSSRAWVVIDQASGRELAASQADLPLAPASLTQLMTAYVLLGDIRKNKLSLGEMVTVPAAAIQMDGARVFLKAGDQVSVDTLLQAMLVESASDATIALVTAADGSEAAFVARMNREAKRLGMSKTRFMNATGLNAPGHESSARDLALLG